MCRNCCTTITLFIRGSRRQKSGSGTILSQQHLQTSGDSSDQPKTIMLSDTTATALTGAAFGASLAASGVYLPSVIIDQFRLTNFHMFHVFATAMGSSA